MSKTQRSLRFVLLAALAAAAPRLRAQDFYTDRLAAGKAAVQAKRFEDAVNEFRIACFGFLDQPVLLSQGLVRLALAESEAKKPDDLRETLSRFLEVERRFPSYAKAALEPEARAEFEALLAKMIPEPTLRSIPSLVLGAQTPERKPEKPPDRKPEMAPEQKPDQTAERKPERVPEELSPAQKEKALQAQAERQPQDAALQLEMAKLSAARRRSKDVVKWAGRALEASPGNPEALALRGHELAARSDYSKARADLLALPPETLNADPDLVADLFVCDAALKDWDAAQALQPRLSEKSFDRKDVIRAKDRLAKETARAQKQAAREAERQASTVPPPPPPVSSPPAEAAPPLPSAPTPPATPPAPPPEQPVPGLPEIRQLILAGKPAEAEKQLLALVPSWPSRREVRLALLEAACLAKDWKIASAQLSALSPFRDGEEPYMFYAAVVIYETGDPDRAKPFLQRALPRIASTPYTQFYARKILGP